MGNEFFNNIDYLLIEGYLWSSESARKAILKAVEISKKKDIKYAPKRLSMTPLPFQEKR